MRFNESLASYNFGKNNLPDALKEKLGIPIQEPSVGPTIGNEPGTPPIAAH